MPAPCDVVVVGAGLSGLYAARLLASAGIEVMVLEAQNRVGGRTLTTYFGDGTFVDDGGQWISPGQHCIVKLADELGVRLFPSWSDGAMVHWRAGVRAVSNGLFLPEDGNSAAATHEAAKVLSEMAETFPPDEPWAAPESAQWDRTTLHSWLATHVTSEPARRVLATSIEGVFARNSMPTSLLAALFWIRCGDPLTPFLTTNDPGPERRFDGGAQQLSQRMADALASAYFSMPRLLPLHRSQMASVSHPRSAQYRHSAPWLRCRRRLRVGYTTNPRFQRCAIT
jgi:monoamine oxidase